MSDTGLAPFAKQIALNPPLNVWKAHTAGIEEMRPLHDALAGALDDLDSGVPQNMSVLYQKKAGTICDVTAYSMMVIGAGLERIKALRGNQSHQPTRFGDRIRRYKDSDGATVGFELGKWADVKAPGILQFKFDATGGMHTFAVERLLSGGLIRFRVYQSYEGLYRLSDFLGLTEGDDYLRMMARLQIVSQQWQDVYGPFEKEQTKPFRIKKKADILASIDREANHRIAILNRTRDAIGRFQELTREDLFLKVFTPLRNLLDGGLTGAGYQTLAGHASEGRVFCKTLLVAYCYEIDPQTFQANFQTLTAGENMLPGWLDPTT